jgi:hypothetical protein
MKPRILNLREMELFRKLVLMAKKYRDCNPEVGMGPSLEMIAKEQAQTLSFKIDEDDIAEVCEEIKGSMFGH